MKYRKKPVVIEAFRWTGGIDQKEDPEWIVDAIRNGTVFFGEKADGARDMFIETLEGTHKALPGDYIVRGVKGELYPCKPDIFEATYEKAAGNDPAEGNGEVKNYVGVKIVQAEPCVQDGREGYRVVYPDGYESWSPKGVFEAAYLCLGDDPTKISRETVIEFIGDNVWSETLEGGKTTLVKAKTLSGFEQIEASSCVDPSNYDEEIGVNCCMKRIEDTIWECLGFVLQWGRDGLKRG